MRKLTLGACKIDRAIQDILPMKTRGNDFLVYSALMMNVNATEHVNNDGIKIFPGQIQTSIKAIAEETGFTDKVVRNTLDRLEADNLIHRRVIKGKYQIITVLSPKRADPADQISQVIQEKTPSSDHCQGNNETLQENTKKGRPSEDLIQDLFDTYGVKPDIDLSRICNECLEPDIEDAFRIGYDLTRDRNKAIGAIMKLRLQVIRLLEAFNLDPLPFDTMKANTVIGTLVVSRKENGFFIEIDQGSWDNNVLPLACIEYHNGMITLNSYDDGIDVTKPMAAWNYTAIKKYFDESRNYNPYNEEYAERLE